MELEQAITRESTRESLGELLAILGITRHEPLPSVSATRATTSPHCLLRYDHVNLPPWATTGLWVAPGGTPCLWSPHCIIEPRLSAPASSQRRIQGEIIFSPISPDFLGRILPRVSSLDGLVNRCPRESPFMF